MFHATLQHGLIAAEKSCQNADLNKTTEEYNQYSMFAVNGYKLTVYIIKQLNHSLSSLSTIENSIDVSAINTIVL